MTISVLDSNGSPQTVNTIGELMALVGEVQTSPTANTLLDRIKAVSTLITTLNGYVDGLETLVTSANTKLDTINTTNTVTKGAGATDSTTQRVALASDSPGVTTLGQAARSGSLPVTIADINSGEYETVAASQTDQAMGATGATGDYLMGLLIVPATTSPGAVQIKDGSGSAITVFTGGASSVSNLVPFMVPLGIYSGSGAWKITTGTNVSVIGIGNFT